jgi:5-(carboxyamino)imidazole ribonucleotide synthase
MVEGIGIVGGGQLGRMLTEAAHPLGSHVTVLDPTPDAPATKAGAEQLLGGLHDPEAIARLAAATDVVTWEIEHINADALEKLVRDGFNVQPSPTTLKTIQDKLVQKTMLREAGLPVADFLALDTGPSSQAHGQQLREVTQALGGAVIFKTRRGGYDGRGNHVFTGDVDQLDTALGGDWVDLYAEKIIPFEKELSVLAARDVYGNIAVYPTVETVHEDNICHTVVFPANLRPALAERAQDIAHETMRQLEGAGVFAIEMFVTESEVLINEIAPRVHNSGHHTIEANVTSQFEQHIRAITGMPLGSTAPRSPAAAMVNVLGTREEPLNRVGLDRVLAEPDTHPHYYGKSSRPARKIGHITVLGDRSEDVLDRARRAREALVI